MKINFNSKLLSNILVLGLAENFDLGRDTNLDQDLQQAIAQIVALRKFEAKTGTTASLTTLNHPQIKYILLVGLGKIKEFNLLAAAKFGGKIIAALKYMKFEQATAILDKRLLADDEAQVYANVAYGANLRNYSFFKYKSAEKLKDITIINHLELITALAEKASTIYTQELEPVAEAIYFSRHLVSEPANIIYPETFANTAKEALAPLGVEVEILGEKEMHLLGMNAILGVGQGSIRESKLLVMQYNGGNPGDAPIAFVGKGVTFDSGGLSLKPANGMEDMKYDMSGAAVVTGLIKALAGRKAKVNIVAIAGLVENMPDGNAQRPSDVVKSMSGQTIEVLNTDAEGRLVLADALWYCQDRFKPKFMIDLATLTGAMVIALGNHHAGLFSNNSELADNLIQAGKNVDEKLWPLPLSNDYDKMIDSVIADVRNTSNSSNGRGAGSITAAQFLKRFVNDVAWAHLDIAGVSWADKDRDLNPAGATVFGIKLLDNFVRGYEKD